MTLIVYLAGAYVLICLLAYAFQRRLVYFPERSLAATPDALGLEYREVRLSTEDSVRVHGWFVPAREAKAALLYCHGNAGNISHRLESIRIFHELGLSVLIFDYRGYGESAGRPDEVGTYLDAQAALCYLFEVERLDPSRVVLFGESLGAAVAIELATHVHPMGLILESAFPSIADVGARAYPWLPVRLLSRIRYDSRDRVTRIDAPKLFIHSRNDEIVPIALGWRVYEMAAPPKSFLEIRGGHNDASLVSGERYVAGLAEFLEQIASDRRP
jgi:fermentation-respiration switch protein FrsA (DUF1100 family)